MLIVSQILLRCCYWSRDIAWSVTCLWYRASNVGKKNPLQMRCNPFSYGPIATEVHVSTHIYTKPILPLRFGKLHLLDKLPRHVIYRPSPGPIIFCSLLIRTPIPIVEGPNCLTASMKRFLLIISLCMKVVCVKTLKYNGQGQGLSYSSWCTKGRVNKLCLLVFVEFAVKKS